MAGRVWSEKELDRRSLRRLSILRLAEEVSGSVAATCRYYGISRNVFYTWKRRYDEGGLDALRDRSSAPHRNPNATSTEVVGKIIHLRQHYHFGPNKIQMYLKRYHDVEISTSGIRRILKRLDMNRLPASQRHKRTATKSKRYEKQRPGHALQVDVKSIEPVTTPEGRRRKYYHYTAIDDYTRLRVLRIYDKHDQKTAIAFMDYVLPACRSRSRRSKLNGAEFQSGFHWHLLDQGINHVYIRPATPRLNGKVERSHRIDSEEFYRLLDGVMIDDTGLFNDKLQEWENYYNCQRPHGALGGQTPYERPKQKTTA